MKTAVSLPDEVFDEAEHLAKRLKISRSELYAKALAELVGYLHKHTDEIIDYGRRQSIGKSIGSGRMEKAVDQVIGSRQKKKGMSWSKAGSQALALLKIAELNGQWQQLWNRLAATA